MKINKFIAHDMKWDHEKISTFWNYVYSQSNPNQGFSEIVGKRIIQLVKKQMKFNFIDNESLDEVQTKLQNLNNVEQHIITQIINPAGRIKFKDIRKVSIGLSNKDIISYNKTV